MKHAVFLALAPLALAGGCATNAGTAPLAEAPVAAAATPVAFGEAVKAGEVVVTPLSLVEDSRCPINARCVWAGRLIVNARIDGAGWRETVLLELGETRDVRGAGVMLASGEPGRMAGEDEPLPAAYRFTFEGS